MHLKTIFTSAFIACALAGHAQDEVAFSADRPGVSTAVDVMPQWKVMWEAGVGYEWADRGGEQTITLNNSLFRLGLTSTCELRFQIDHALTRSTDDDWRGGVANVALGTKVKIFDGWRGVPKFSLMGNVLIPRGDDHLFLPSHVGGQLHLLMQSDVCSWFNVGYEVGSDWSGCSPAPEAFAAACFNFQPQDRLTCFVESYNYFSSDAQWYDKKFLCAAEAGIAYMLTPRLQFDLTADMHFNRPNNYVNLACGLAWLIN